MSRSIVTERVRGGWSNRSYPLDGTLRTARLLATSGSIPTPFLLIDEAEIVRCLSYFERHLPEVRLFYAVKANPHPLIVGYFAERGLSFDVSSAQELSAVAEMGISGSRIIFTNPVTTPDCLMGVFSNGVCGHTFDNPIELAKIADFRRRHGVSPTPELYLRIRVRSRDVQIDLNRKFGCLPEEARRLIKRAQEFGLRPAGIAFHVGTQSYRAANFATGIRASMRIADTVRRMDGLELSVINIGGGFPDPLVADRQGTTLERLFSDVRSICRDATGAGYTLFAEPGRLLVSSAGLLVTRVIGRAMRSGRWWLYLDDGIYGCYSGRSFDRKAFQFCALPGPHRSSPFRENSTPFVVAGPTCDSIDVVDEKADLPSDISVGDFVCSPNLGAYSLATACRFNGFGRVNVAFVKAAERDVRRVVRVSHADGPTREIELPEN